MTKLVICGQAPSRVGDGRAFSGPSGRRLASLFGLPDYETLASMVTLTNIFDVPAARRVIACRPRSSKRKAPGDEFDADQAAINGFALAMEWSNDPELVVVLACGIKVVRAITGSDIERYKGKAFYLKPAHGFDIWHFPHPSGASQYWNDPENVREAKRFLRRLLNRYGFDEQ